MRSGVLIEKLKVKNLGRLRKFYHEIIHVSARDKTIDTRTVKGHEHYAATYPR